MVMNHVGFVVGLASGFWYESISKPRQLSSAHLANHLTSKTGSDMP